jgi:general secretion pathway protein C
LNLGFIVIGAYLLADIANFFVASRLEGTITSEKLSQTIYQDNAKHVLVARDYGSIFRRNIFDSGIPDPVPVKYIPPPPMPLPPPLPPPVAVVPPKAPLNMTLIGTVVSADGPSHSYAVIEDGRTRRQYIYRIGDFLLQDAKLVQIYRTRVVISRGEDEEVLVTSLSGLKGGTVPATPVPQSMIPPPIPRERSLLGGVRQVSKDQWVMDREDVDDAIAHLPELLTKARVVPNFTDGKADGFRIFAIREDSLYANIGLQNGDILRRVNNIEVGNPQNFLQVFEQLKDEENIKIDLVRNNKEETFHIDIR